MDRRRIFFSPGLWLLAAMALAFPPVGVVAGEFLLQGRNYGNFRMYRIDVDQSAPPGDYTITHSITGYHVNLSLVHGGETVSRTHYHMNTTISDTGWEALSFRGYVTLRVGALRGTRSLFGLKEQIADGSRIIRIAGARPGEKAVGGDNGMFLLPGRDYLGCKIYGIDVADGAPPGEYTISLPPGSKNKLNLNRVGRTVSTTSFKSWQRITTSDRAVVSFPGFANLDIGAVSGSIALIAVRNGIADGTRILKIAAVKGGVKRTAAGETFLLDREGYGKLKIYEIELGKKVRRGDYTIARPSLGENELHLLLEGKKVSTAAYSPAEKVTGKKTARISFPGYVTLEIGPTGEGQTDLQTLHAEIADGVKVLRIIEARRRLAGGEERSL